MLDNVRSAHNVGSVFRTSDAFLVEKSVYVVLLQTPPQKEIRKTALGASESVNWQNYANSIDCIKELQGMWLLYHQY